MTRFDDNEQVSTDYRGMIVNNNAIVIDDGSTHCTECFSGSQDTNFGYGDVAIPEGCKDEDCECHGPMLNESPPVKVGRITDETGNRYGRLTILYFVGTNPPHSLWAATCDCGKSTVVKIRSVRRGHTTSCGCRNAEINRGFGERTSTHGKSGSPAHRVWLNMRKRCLSPGATGFKHYGGRGITVCKRWDDFALFDLDMGPRPSPQHTLERIDVNGNYEPSNCKWATISEQANNRRDNHRLTWKGVTLNVAQWAIELGVKRDMLYKRLRMGWPTHKVLGTPVNIAFRREAKCS